MNVHPTYNLTRYDRIQDACFAAEVDADLYGDPYTVIECGGGLGFAAVRTADLDQFDLSDWQIRSQWPANPDSARAKRRRNHNAAIVLATSFSEVMP